MYKDTLENKTEFIHRGGGQWFVRVKRVWKVLHLVKCASVKSTIWCSSSFNYLTRLQTCHSVMVRRCHPSTFRNLRLQHVESGSCSDADAPWRPRSDREAGKLECLSFLKGTAFPSSVTGGINCTVTLLYDDKSLVAKNKQHISSVVFKTGRTVLQNISLGFTSLRWCHCQQQLKWQTWRRVHDTAC